ncbi:NADP-dependent oxidoreductase domain-containing protein [Lasiosphaeria hispida]|uniref:NADP-dependent oxidoreductase domain-containing protein n=1 Tax=Lasiosphaeria hispida TaxID=260671 RepID=A0AAJ0MAJ8_9PEZI|nr:NADP-dependent oxidoreductase domain-containing protein [Lasiosphaeria hispida]
MAQPRIILGLMGFAPDENTGARLHKVDDLKQALDIFQARGYSELDTARAYGGGAQEGFTRQAGWKERGFSIATKVYPIPPGNHAPEIITREFETSLRELGTDSVDIAYLHAPDRSIPFALTLAAMDALHKAGKFQRLGLSNFAAFEVAEVVLTCARRGWVRPTVYQAVYNCMQRGIEAELLPACRRYGLDVVVYSPIVGGLLSGQITRKETVPAEGRFSDKFLNGWIRERYFRDSTFDAIAELRAAADREGVSTIEVALRWLVHHSKLDVRGGDGIIIGVSKLEHIDSNLDYLEKGPLSEELLGALDRMWRIAKGEEAPYWHFDLEYAYDTKEALFGEGAK